MTTHSLITLRPGALDELKARYGIRTDDALAARLGISAPLLSQVRSGVRGVGPSFLVGAAREFHATYPGPLYATED